MTDTIKLLIVDDVEVVINSVKRILDNDKTFNYVIDVAYSAEVGLNKALLNDYDIIITDIVMPGMDGMELLKELINKNVRSQIIMITGYATMKTALLAIKMGAFDFIAKPFTSDELRSSVHRAVYAKSERFKKRLGNLIDKNVINPNDVYSIPGKTWARIMENFSAQLGVENDFINSIVEINKLELSEKGEKVKQGQGFGKIITKDKIVHTLPSPLSGTVMAINEMIIHNASLLKESQNSTTWLILIEPSDFEKEVSNLVLLD